MNDINIEKLVIAATEAFDNAYAPYSNFKVGSAVLDENGNIHKGCNVENAAYPIGSCAEEQAIGNMITNGGKIIKKIVIIGASKEPITPCGACRQRIREFCDKDTTIYIYDIELGFIKSYDINSLLPDSFGPDNL